jgi:hypothetical protein
MPRLRPSPAAARSPKLSADGSRVLYSTYLPASLATVSAMAVDSQGNAYITGKSAADHTAAVKLSADGSAFLYNRVLAGTNQEAGTAIAVDAAGNATVTGMTTSTFRSRQALSSRGSWGFKMHS